MRSPLASMTGFGRASAQAEDATVLVEIKSVNGRGLDIRSRLPHGFDILDADIRRLIGEKLTRGSVSVSLTVKRHAANGELAVNQIALDQVLGLIETLGKRLDARKPAIEAILALDGVIESREAERTQESEQRLNAAILDCVSVAIGALGESRRIEGEALGTVIGERIAEIETLAEAGRAHPARSRDAISARLAEQIAALGEAGKGLDPDRLHQEALILATKADIAEELDRFTAHVKAAKTLLVQGGPVGRKLDFLSQEFNREANTLCSKSNDVSLTAIGLDLKAAIDQLREQVQNLE